MVQARLLGGLHRVGCPHGGLVVVLAPRAAARLLLAGPDDDIAHAPEGGGLARALLVGWLLVVGGAVRRARLRGRDRLKSGDDGRLSGLLKGVRQAGARLESPRRSVVSQCDDAVGAQGEESLNFLEEPGEHGRRVDVGLDRVGVAKARNEVLCREADVRGEAGVGAADDARRGPPKMPCRRTRSGTVRCRLRQ